MNLDRWMMKQISPEHRAVIRRRERLVALFSISYDRKRKLMKAAGIPFPVTRTQYVNSRIRALRLPETVVCSPNSRQMNAGRLTLSGVNQKYELEYRQAEKSGIRMQSSLQEYVNSRRKTDGLPPLTAREFFGGQFGVSFRMQVGVTPEILVFGDIVADGGIGAAKFVEQLRKLDGASEIKVRINSDGGDPYQALAMYNALREAPARIITVNEGMVASAASLLFMAGDVREMKPASQLMIHEPTVGMSGRSEDLQRAAEAIDKSRDAFAQIYAERSGNTLDYILMVMKDETYFSAQEAVQKGFATVAT